MPALKERSWETKKQRKEIWEKTNTSTNGREQENHKRPGNTGQVH